VTQLKVIMVMSLIEKNRFLISASQFQLSW